MSLRMLPLLIALAFSLAPSSQAAFVSAPPASSPPSTSSENAYPAFLPNDSESRIGLLVANDPLDKTDPMGLDPGDPFPTALAAGQDAVRFTNPTSIRQNLEYGGFLYKLNGKYYAQQPQHLEEREGGATKGTLHGPLPPHSTVAGNYHDHADYSKKEGGKVVRTTRDKDAYDSDHFSKSDKKEMSAFAKGQEEHTAVLGTPSGQIRAIDFKSDKLKEETVGKTDVPVERQKTGN